MIPFSASQIEALGDVAHAWPSTPFALIGASALSHHIALSWRQTQDLDLTIAVDLEDLPASTAKLVGWTRHPRLEHEWQSPLGVKVDLVPAGPGLLAAGYLKWPMSGFTMNLVGLDLALAHTVPLALPDGVVIRVASAPAIVVLKMTAWLDRPADRERDLADLAHLFDEYLDGGDERRYDDPVMEQGLSYDEVGPYVLGRDLAAIIKPSHRAVIDAFLAKVGDQYNAPHAQMRRLGPASLRRDDDALAVRLEALRRGLAIAP